MTVPQRAVDSHSVMASPMPSDPMITTTNGTLATNRCGRRSRAASRAISRSRSGERRTYLGALAFRAFERALAWLVVLARAFRSTGRGYWRGLWTLIQPTGLPGTACRGGTTLSGRHAPRSRGASAWACRTFCTTTSAFSDARRAPRYAGASWTVSRSGIFPARPFPRLGSLRPTFDLWGPLPVPVARLQLAGPPEGVPARCVDCVRSRRRQHVRRHG